MGIFVTGFLSNGILASFLSYLGDRMGVPLYYAPILYFLEEDYLRILLLFEDLF